LDLAAHDGLPAGIQTPPGLAGSGRYRQCRAAAVYRLGVTKDEHARLPTAGPMTPAGLVAVEAARADGYLWIATGFWRSR